MSDGSRIKQLSGGCIVASLAETSDRARRKHASCKGCGCVCHHDWNPPRCTRCLQELLPGEWLAGHTRCYANEVACDQRVKVLIQERAPAYTQRAAAEKAERAARVVAKREEPKERVGVCAHCGAVTKGGQFLPGHDAKLKNVLKEQALAGSTAAWVELILRDWAKLLPKTWAPTAEALELAELYRADAHARAVFLQQQLERRTGVS